MKKVNNFFWENFFLFKHKFNLIKLLDIEKFFINIF